MKGDYSVKKYTRTSKKKIIGKEIFISKKTGQEESFNVIEKYVDTNFYKIWLLDLLGVLDIIGNKKMKVVDYLFSNMRREDNTISATQKTISEETNVSTKVVSQTLKILRETNFLKKIQNGLYMINPDLVVRGTAGKRLNLLIRYQQVEKEIKKEIKKYKINTNIHKKHKIKHKTNKATVKI
jgi:hypothetical protein